MIDFHTHILYGLDDGAQSLAESVLLIEDLKKQGVNTILLTPHFYFSNIPEEGFIDYRKKILDEVTEAVKHLNVTLIPACEVYLTKSSLTDNFYKFAINGTHYMLTELPFRTILSNSVFERLSDIIDYSGLIPIIAHAERYPAIQKKPEIISKLINMGCLIQMNTASLFNKSTKKLAQKMLKSGQVHCIGTDCHNKSRPPIYSKAQRQIVQLCGNEYFKQLQKNMETILSNGTIEIQKIKPIKKLFGIYI